MKISKKSRDMFLFMVIGDGHIDKNGCLKMTHSISQKEYLNYKRKLLSSVGIKTSESVEFDNGNYIGIETHTKTYKFSKLYRKILYAPKKNIAKRKILNRLNPLGIAIWYMDSGGLNHKRENGQIHASNLVINTNLPIEENQIIIDYFKEVWKVKFTQVKSKGKYRLRCGTKEARKFINIVKPYIKNIECMQHKIDIKNNY